MSPQKKSIFTNEHALNREPVPLNNVVTVRFLGESCLLIFLKCDHAELCEVVIDNKLAKAIAKCQRAKILPIRGRCLICLEMS